MMLQRIGRPSRNPKPISFALRRELRAYLDSGGTQDQLAELCGVRQPVISSFLNDRKQLSFSSADKIAHALRIAPDKPPK